MTEIGIVHTSQHVGNIIAVPGLVEPVASREVCRYISFDEDKIGPYFYKKALFIWLGKVRLWYYGVLGLTKVHP